WLSYVLLRSGQSISGRAFPRECKLNSGVEGLGSGGPVGSQLRRPRPCVGNQFGEGLHVRASVQVLLGQRDSSRDRVSLLAHGQLALIGEEGSQQLAGLRLLGAVAGGGNGPNLPTQGRHGGLRRLAHGQCHDLVVQTFRVCHLRNLPRPVDHHCRTAGNELVLDLYLPPVQHRRRGRTISHEVNQQTERVGGLGRVDLAFVGAIAPEERQELPCSLIGGVSTECDAVAAPSGQSRGGFAHLLPGGGRRHACFIESPHVIKERNRVDRRGQAVYAPIKGTSVDDALGIPIGGNAELVERAQRRGLSDLLQVRIVQHQHVRQGSR